MTDDPQTQTPQITSQEPPQEYQEIHDKPMSQVIEETVNPPQEEPKENPIEKAAEAVVETKEEPKKPDFDPEQFKKDIIDTVSQHTADKIAELLGKKGDIATKEETNKYQDIVNKFQKEHGRNPTWDELIPSIVDEVQTKLTEQKKAQEVEEQKKAEEVEAQKKAQEAKVEEDAKFINSLIDDELDELYRSNKLPKIVNKDDPNDPGVVAKRQLFQSMLDVNMQRQKEGKPLIYSAHRVFNMYYKPPQTQPAGADAPVSAGNRAASPASDAVKYDEIHNTPWHKLTRIIGGK